MNQLCSKIRLKAKKKYIHVYNFFLIGQLLSSLPPQCGILKTEKNRKQTPENPRRISKEMACKIYEQTGAIVAIGSGNKKSTYGLQSSYLLESIKTGSWRKV